MFFPHLFVAFFFSTFALSTAQVKNCNRNLVPLAFESACNIPLTLAKKENGLFVIPDDTIQFPHVPYLDVGHDSHLFYNVSFIYDKKTNSFTLLKIFAECPNPLNGTCKGRQLLEESVDGTPVTGVNQSEELYFMTKPGDFEAQFRHLDSNRTNLPYGYLLPCTVNNEPFTVQVEGSTWTLTLDCTDELESRLKITLNEISVRSEEVVHSEDRGNIGYFQYIENDGYAYICWNETFPHKLNVTYASNEVLYHSPMDFYIQNSPKLPMDQLISNFLNEKCSTYFTYQSIAHQEHLYRGQSHLFLKNSHTRIQFDASFSVQDVKAKQYDKERFAELFASLYGDGLRRHLNLYGYYFGYEATMRLNGTMDIYNPTAHDIKSSSCSLFTQFSPSVTLVFFAFLPNFIAI